MQSKLSVALVLWLQRSSFARKCLAEILKPRDLCCKLVVWFRFGLDCETTAGSGGIGCVSVNWKMHSAICGCGNLLEVPRGHRLQLRLFDNHVILLAATILSHLINTVNEEIFILDNETCQSTFTETPRGVITTTTSWRCPWKLGEGFSRSVVHCHYTATNFLQFTILFRVESWGKVVSAGNSYWQRGLTGSRV